jgi:murein DD-endopeptidase MepM/ murein hydrolase activator NlpD
MNQNCFVVDFGLKRVQVTYRTLLYLFLTLVILVLGFVALGSSYIQMSWKVSRYNRLLADFDRLRNRYQELQRISRQRSEQMASLESLASEVSVAYGLNEPHRAATEAPSLPSPLGETVRESIAEYNFLKAASFGGIYRQYAYRWQIHKQPNLWPMTGIVRSSFGGRSDPFSGEGTFHTGIDLAAPSGTPVHVTADGVVLSAHWAGGYGKLIVVDHGNGIQTYYAHLSRLSVMAGEEVRAGQLIGYSGSTGRSTGPHMHYEVRLAGTPVNPYKFLSKADRPAPAQSASLRPAAMDSHNDLGL